MRLAVAVALAGCFGKPAFSGKDGAVGDDAAIDMAIDTPLACTPSKPSAAGLVVDTTPADTRVMFLDGSLLGFRNVLTRYPMPDRLIVGGQNLVAAPEGCAFEDAVGIAVYPIFNIGSQTLAGAPTHGLDADMVGPAFTQLRTQWTIQLPNPCSPTPTQAAGNTSWGFFPDGKVVRNDTIVPGDMAPVTPGASGCNCPTAGMGTTNALVTSYTTFEATQLSAVTRAGEPEQSLLPSPGVLQGALGACARGTAQGKVAVYWDRPDGMDPVPRPTRLRRVTNGANSNHDIVAFVYDIFATQPGVAIPQDASYGIRTHMMLNGGSLPCTDLLANVEGFAGAQPLMIGPAGSLGMISYTSGGVFDDNTPYTGPIRIQGTLPSGFAVRLRFPGFTAVATDRAADRVVWQRHTDGSFIVFFKDGIDGTTAITMTPECRP